MPIITFWSNNEKAIGQTVAAATAATVMAIEHNYKVLLISADLNNDVIERCFGAQESNKEILKGLIVKPQMNFDSGINGLLKLADSKRVTPDVIHDYTKIVFKNRLEILYSPMNIADERETNRIIGDIKNIITNAARYYDYVFVDLKKGLKCSEQLEILQLSDVIVENTNQDIKKIDNFFAIEEINSLRYKFVFNICKYDKNSKYNSKNLSRTILKKIKICETDYNTLILDATQEGNLAELLLRFKTLRENGEDLLFITKIKELIETILLKHQEIRARM
jgi:MinD-like ATPase involved in chromosome partitioning or flagellar assembly